MAPSLSALPTELKENIFANLNTTSLKAVRLVNEDFRAHSLRTFFHTVTIYYNQVGIDKLLEISRRDEIRDLVKTLKVFLCIKLTKMEMKKAKKKVMSNPWIKAEDLSPVKLGLRINRAIKTLATKWYNFENLEFTRNGKDTASLTVALSNLQNCHNLQIESGKGGDINLVLGQLDPAQQHSNILKILTAFEVANVPLLSFDVLCASAIYPISDGISARSLNSSGSLSRLRSFKLELCSDTDIPPGALSKLPEIMPLLELLHISVHETMMSYVGSFNVFCKFYDEAHFPKLRQLNLKMLHTFTVNLEHFIARHRSTLSKLTLQTSVGDAQRLGGLIASLRELSVLESLKLEVANSKWYSWGHDDKLGQHKFAVCEEWTGRVDVEAGVKDLVSRTQLPY
jgi:hypothetical protein